MDDGLFLPKVSALNEAERKGIEKGEKNKAIEIAKSLLNIGLDVRTISKSTGLNINEIEELKKYLRNGVKDVKITKNKYNG